MLDQVREFIMQKINSPEGLIALFVAVVVAFHMAVGTMAMTCEKLAEAIAKFMDRTKSDVDNKAHALLLVAASALHKVLKITTKLANFINGNRAHPKPVPVEGKPEAPSA